MSKRALRRLMLTIGSLLALLAALAACQSTGPTGEPFKRTEPEKTAEELREGIHGPSQESFLVSRFGKEAIFRQCRLVLPAGLFGEETYVTIALPGKVPPGFIPESAYSITPEVSLAKPALLSLHYFDDDLEPGEDENDIKLVRLFQGVWRPVGDFTLDTFNNLVSTQIDRFGTYALQVLAPRKPLLNTPPVARISVEVLLGEEAEAAAAEEAGAPPQAGEPVEGVAPPGSGRETAGAKPGETGGAEPQAAPPDEAPPPLASEPVLIGEGESAEGAAAPRSGGGSAGMEVPVTRAEDLLPGELVEPQPMAEGESPSFLVETPPEPKKPEPTIGARVRFSGAESTDEDGSVIRYLWDLNADGVADRVSSEPDTERTYDTYGSFLAILKVEDDQEPTGSDIAFATFAIPRDPLAPRLPFGVSAVGFPAEVSTGGEVVLGVQATGGEPPYTFGWSFSDGTTSDEQAVLLVAGKPGTFTGNLTVADSSGRTIQRSVSLKVVSPKREAAGKPDIRLLPGRVYLDVPGRVDFEAIIRNAREPVRLVIDPGFGEPVTTQEKNFSVSFPNAGHYVLTVTLSDVAGRGAKAFAPVMVTAGATGELVAGAPARLTFGVKYSSDGGSVAFEAVGVEKRERLNWDFGDGTASEERSPVKKYARTGEYRVRMTVDDGVSLRTAERTVPFGNGALAAAIDLPQTVRGMTPFKLTPRAVVTGGKFPLFFRWKLGDRFSEEEYPQFALDQPGSYQLQLTVGDAKGDTYSANPVMVEVVRAPKKFRYPVAYFVESEEEATQVKLAEFDGSSEFTFTLGPETARDVVLAPQGTGLALLAGDGFAVWDLAGGRRVLEFTPSQGRVTAVFLTSSPELLAFNLENAAGVRGFLHSEASGILPVSEGNERVLDLTPDGSAILLGSEQAVRMLRVDPFTGGLSGPVGVFGEALEGKLTADAEYAFLLGPDKDVYSVHLPTGTRARITDDGAAKRSLQVSDDGQTIAYSLENGEIVVIRPRGEERGLPVNLTQLNGFAASRWVLSPDGQLVLGYGTVTERSGLYLLNLAVDLAAAGSAELAPSFYADSTPVFAMSGHRDRFDVLLNPEGRLREEVEKEP